MTGLDREKCHSSAADVTGQDENVMNENSAKFGAERTKRPWITVHMVKGFSTFTVFSFSLSRLKIFLFLCI